jgi:hypothetical protein
MIDDNRIGWNGMDRLWEDTGFTLQSTLTNHSGLVFHAGISCCTDFVMIVMILFSSPLHTPEIDLIHMSDESRRENRLMLL